MSINETRAGYLIMRLSGVIHASGGAEDQDKDQDGGHGGKAQRGGYRRRIRIIYVLIR